MMFGFDGLHQAFQDPGFPFIEARDSGFQSKIAARFGIESILARGRWDAKNKPWDYGIRGFLGRDYGIEEHHWRPSNFTFQKIIDYAEEP